MSFNRENREGHYKDTKIVGKGSDGAMQMTFSAILGVLLIIGGVALGIYLNTQMNYGFIFGIPFVVIGIVLPLFLLWGLSGKVEEPNE